MLLSSRGMTQDKGNPCTDRYSPFTSGPRVGSLVLQPEALFLCYSLYPWQGVILEAPEVPKGHVTVLNPARAQAGH